jgi:hypothetical protein
MDLDQLAPLECLAFEHALHTVALYRTELLHSPLETLQHRFHQLFEKALRPSLPSLLSNSPVEAPANQASQNGVFERVSKEYISA